MNRRDALIAGLLAAILVVILLPFAREGVDPHHDGIMLKPALDVLSGQVLFRDTFSQYGALTTYLQVAALWFQPTLLALRYQTVFVYAVTLLFLYAAWRMILPRSLAIFSCGLFILFTPAYEKNWLDQYWMLLAWSSVFAMMFQSLSLYALFRLIAGAQPTRWGVLLGVSCACVFWCRQPVGLIMAGCVAAIWLALGWTNWTPVGQSKRSVLFGILGGFGAVHVLFLGNILVSGAWSEWWYQNFTWPSKWALGGVHVHWADFVTVFVHPAAGGGLMLLLLSAAAPHLLGKFRPGLAPRYFAGYYLCLAGGLVWQHEWTLRVLAVREGGWTIVLPAVIVLWSLFSLTQAFRARGAARPTEYYLGASLAALALGSLLQYYPMPDCWHVLWSLAPAFGLAVFAFWRCLGWTAPTVAAVLAAAFLPSVYVKVRSAADCLSRPLVAITSPALLRGMKVPAELARSYGEIAAALERILKQQPGLPGVLVGNDALFLCFMKNRVNPTPYYVTWSALADSAANQRRVSYINRFRPLMFFHRADWNSAGEFYRRAHYVPVLYVPPEALEIAIPEELADAVGLTVYGAASPEAAARPAPPP